MLASPETAVGDLASPYLTERVLTSDPALRKALDAELDRPSSATRKACLRVAEDAFVAGVLKAILEQYREDREVLIEYLLTRRSLERAGRKVPDID